MQQRRDTGGVFAKKIMQRPRDIMAVFCKPPATRFFNQLKTLTPKPGAVEKMEELEKMFDTASEQMASA